MAYNVAGLHGLQGSLELIQSIGVTRIEQRVLQLTDYLSEKLLTQGWRVHSPRQTAGEKSGIVLTSKPWGGHGPAGAEFRARITILRG